MNLKLVSYMSMHYNFLHAHFFRLLFFFFKQKTAYERRISDWSSDVCSSDLNTPSRSLSAADDTPRPRAALNRVSPVTATHSPGGGRSTWAVTSGLMRDMRPMCCPMPMRLAKSKA